MIDHIEESSLRVLLAAGCVRHFELQQRERGFDVYLYFLAQGKTAPQRAMLVTQRVKNKPDKSPRNWASLDNFVRHVARIAPVPPEIRIQLSPDPQGD